MNCYINKLNNTKDLNPYVDSKASPSEVDKSINTKKLSKNKLNKLSSEQRQTQGLISTNNNKSSLANVKHEDDSEKSSENESETSEDEVNSLLENKTPEMKKINLFRRPTEEISSPTKKDSPINQQLLEEKVNQIIKNNELVTTEKITRNYMKYTDLKTEELRVELKELLAGTKTGLNSNINLLKDYMKEELRSLLQVVMRTNDEFLVHLQEEIKRRNRDKSDIMIKIAKFEEIVNECSNVKTITEESVYSIGEVIRTLIDIMHLDSILGSKDEEDRNSISLWGFEEKNTSKPYNNVISLDKNCMSCSNSAKLVHSAFKMACLAYLPSKVEFKGNTFNRIDLFTNKIK